MAIPVSEGSARELPPVGLQLARCTEMIDLGTSEDEYQGKKYPRRKVWLSFELCEAVKQDAEGKPYCQSIGGFYTASLGEKAALRHLLESWRGKPFTPEQLKHFDLKNVLGKGCNINVLHTAKPSGGQKAVIGSINPLRSADQLPEQVNQTRLIEFDNFDWTCFNSLPDFLSKEIIRSDEYAKIYGDTGDTVDVADQVDTYDNSPF